MKVIWQKTFKNKFKIEYGDCSGLFFLFPNVATDGAGNIVIVSYHWFTRQIAFTYYRG